MSCRICGMPGADSSGRCFDCVNAEFNQITQEMSDKRSVWKLAEIEREREKESR